MRPGDVLASRYRLDKTLGKGGSGVVYSATQLPLGRVVAVKVLSPTDAQMRARFSQEAALAQRLDHPHTVRILDFGFGPDEVPFIVFEHLKGRTLHEMLVERGPLQPSVARAIAVQILKSLMEAHSLGIVHRDIKPANIFVTPHPGEPHFVKVLDFGIAKDTLAASGPTSRAVPAPFAEPAGGTQSVGSPRYMAPEQARGEPVGPETDIYAVGLVLSEMLSGRSVFSEPSLVDLLIARASDDPAPIPPDVRTSSLGPIVGRATEKSRSARYPSAEAMIVDLEAVTLADAPTKGAPWVGSHVKGATPLDTAAPWHRGPVAARRRPWLVPLLVATTAVIGAAAFVAFFRPWEPHRKRAARSASTSTSTVTAAPQMPPPPHVDWGARAVSRFTEPELALAVTKAGYEVRRSDVIDAPGFFAITMTVAKPPCGGSLLFYVYGSDQLTNDAEASLRRVQHARVVRTGNRILQVALGRVETPEGDPACTDPLAAVLTH